MNTKLVLLSLLELGLGILLGVVVLYFAYSILSKVVFKNHGIEKTNVAYAVLVSSILFAVGNIMEGAVDPIANVIRQFSSAHESLTTVFIESLKYTLMFVFISMVLALLINIIAVKLFTTLTEVDEFKEIAAGNISPALITGTITIIISIFAKSPAVQLMEAIIPYPNLPGIL